jgi:hypothetical protein
MACEVGVEAHLVVIVTLGLHAFQDYGCIFLLCRILADQDVRSCRSW